MPKGWNGHVRWWFGRPPRPLLVGFRWLSKKGWSIYFDIIAVRLKSEGGPVIGTFTHTLDGFERPRWEAFCEKQARPVLMLKSLVQ